MIFLCFLNYVFLFQVFFRKMTTAKMKKETEKHKRMLAKKPNFSLDHLVRERYAMHYLS